jgi:hypothetical protein
LKFQWSKPLKETEDLKNMAWKTITFESIDIRDGFLHEIFISAHELVDTKPRAGEKKPGKAHKYFGIEKGRGPVSFLATDSLAKDLQEMVNTKTGEVIGKADDFPMLVRLQWKGKVPIKGGEQMFNVFACERFQPGPGEPFPIWTTKSAFAGQESFVEKDVIQEELPDAGPVEVAGVFDGSQDGHS